MRRAALLAVIGLIAVSCSGVTQEDLDKALAEAADLQEQVSDLQDSVADLEAELGSAEARASEAEGRASDLEDSLADAEEDLVRAGERYEDLVELSETPSFPAAVLAGVHARGLLRCGISGSLIGFSESQGGTVVGFDADFCRAVAAAVLGDATAVEFVPVSGANRWQAVRSGEVDVMFRNSTHTLTRDAALGELVDFGPALFYDGQQFMGASSEWDEASAGSSLDGASVCSTDNARAIDAATAFAAESSSQIQIVIVDSLAEAVGDPACDLLTSEGTFLAHLRETAIRDGEISSADLVIFPAIPITREPLAPVYNEGDTIWADIVDWVVYATIIADEKGVGSANVDTATWDSEAQRLFGAEGEYATRLGLDADAFYTVVKQVGNYGEIYDRNLGVIGYSRIGGLNRPASDGGLLYAPPAR